jgi:O-acetylhomoserine (thiol)-lyase
MRDFGCYPSGMSGFLLNLGLETLALRMERYCQNGLKLAKFFENHPKIEAINYPGLENNKYHKLAQKYLPKGTSGVMSITIKGGKAEAVKFMDKLQMASKEVHVADIRTCVLHPASATHRQMNDNELLACGIYPDLIRLSCGLEDADDLISDIKNALDNM